MSGPSVIASNFAVPQSIPLFSSSSAPLASAFGVGYATIDGVLTFSDGITWNTQPYSLSNKLIMARDKAFNNNIFDLGNMASPPTVAIGTTPLANPVTYTYGDVGGPKRIRMFGVPFGDTSLMCSISAGTTLNIQNLSSPGVKSANVKGMVGRVRFTGSVIQLNVNGYNLPLIRVHVNGALVTVTGSPLLTVPTGSYIQLTFAQRGTYDISVEFEQSLTFTGVTVDEADSVHSVEEIPLPILGLGDSYLQGLVSDTGSPTGGQTFISAFREISGCNLMAQGISGTGWKAGFAMTDPERLALAAATANYANAPLICIWLGTNDVTGSGSGISAAVKTVLNYLLLNTRSKIAVFSAWPRTLNLSAQLTGTDAAIQAGVSDINNQRAAFIPMSAAANPWVTGTRYVGSSGGVAGNSHAITGSDQAHPSVEGSIYLARKSIDALIATSLSRAW